MLVVAGLHAHAVLKTHHLPVHPLQLALAAQRNEGLHGLVLLGRAQFAAHAAIEADDAGAGTAGDAFGARQLHLHGRAAVRAVELAAFFVLGGFVLEALELQVFQQYRLAALHVGRGVAVVDADHFTVGAAQLDHAERLAQRGQLGQFALGRDQRCLAGVGHAVGLAVDGGGGADAKALGRRHFAAGVDGAREDIGTVVLAQRRQRAIVQEGGPFGPDPCIAFVLQAAHQSEGHILAVELDAPAGHELQGAVVVEQLGHLAQAREHVAAAHDGALAVAADGVRGLRAAEFNRRAAARAGRAVVTLCGVGGHRGAAACAALHGFEAFLASSAYPSSANSYI